METDTENYFINIINDNILEEFKFEDISFINNNFGFLNAVKNPQAKIIFLSSTFTDNSLETSLFYLEE